MCALRKIVCTEYILSSTSAPCWHILMSSRPHSHSVMSGECNNLYSCFQKCYILLAEWCIVCISVDNKSVLYLLRPKLSDLTQPDKHLACLVINSDSVLYSCRHVLKNI